MTYQPKIGDCVTLIGGTLDGFVAVIIDLDSKARFAYLVPVDEPNAYSVPYSFDDFELETMKKIILVNGPPRSGKDTVGDIIAKIAGGTPVKFAASLKRATHAFFHALRDDFSDDTLYVATRASINDAYYEQTKETSMPLFGGLTPREAYIGASETFLKPTFDNDVFGNILADQIERSDKKLFVVTDSGFQSEAEVMIRRFGLDNVKLIRLTRAPYTFEGDSRGYIALEASTYGIRNEGTYDALKQAVALALNHFGIKNSVPLSDLG